MRQARISLWSSDFNNPMTSGKFIAGLFGIGLTVALAISSKATDFPLGTVGYSQNITTNLFISPNTNSTSASLYTEKNCFHAIQINMSTNLVSSATFVVDGCLDNTNWVPLTTTNSIANTGGTLLFSYAGAMSYMRVRNVIGTNAVATVIYLGGQ